MRRQWLAWSWAAIVMVITIGLVILDLTDNTFRRYWYLHSFTSSVLSGILVLLLTVLIVDRVAKMRQLRNQAVAMGAQAAVILAQAKRAADAVTSVSPSDENHEGARDELRAYTQMLLVSAPLLIGATVPRRFLESAQRFAGQLYRALREAGDKPVPKTGLDAGVDQLQAAAAPLLQALNRPERAAVEADAPKS
ncbi:MAG TPA: hypothetical protein VMF57_16775 [Solirubrobacteraceae bacterium]|nr:hypothetical protein [Solirubrobacteraceae bacterium]